MFKILEWTTEAIGWLQIFASPLLIGLGVGAFIYFPNPSTVRLIVGISVAILGLLIGVFWASKAWRTKGTVSLISRISATPELDNMDDENTICPDLKKEGQL